MKKTATKTKDEGKKETDKVTENVSNNGGEYDISKDPGKKVAKSDSEKAAEAERNR